MKPQAGVAEKQRVNKPSALLSPEENEQLFTLLGRRCQTMCTAVAKLFTTEAPAHSTWIKRHTGALCFVRDSANRSYFMRMYSLTKGELVWEEEMYDEIFINQSKEWLIDFEGKNSLVALDFASESEASSFYKTATTTIANRSKRRQVTNKRRSRRISPPTPSTNLGEEEHTVTLRNAPIQSANVPVQPSSHFPTVPQFGGGKQRARTAKKLTTADISMPTDFKHVVHVGWTAQNGFDLTGQDPNSMNTLNSFLVKAGVSEQELNDRKTRAFIYDFIESNNVLKIEEESSSLSSDKPDKPSGSVARPGVAVPPPVPSRQSGNGSQRIAPPPPPPTTTIPHVRQAPPPLPKTVPPKAGPPTRPPPITNTGGRQTLQQGNPPPPPPPPPPMLSPPVGMSATSKPLTVPATSVPDGRGALLESIRGGINLKKVEVNSVAMASSGNSNLLAEIRQGKELRPAAERELNAAAPRNSGGGSGVVNMANALRAALEERQRAVKGSSDESDDDDSSDNDWDA